MQRKHQTACDCLTCVYPMCCVQWFNIILKASKASLIYVLQDILCVFTSPNKSVLQFPAVTSAMFPQWLLLCSSYVLTPWVRGRMQRRSHLSQYLCEKIEKSLIHKLGQMPACITSEPEGVECKGVSIFAGPHQYKPHLALPALEFCLGPHTLAHSTHLYYKSQDFCTYLYHI